MRSSYSSGGSKIAAGIMGLTMLLIILFSAFYLAAEADHECCGEDCAVCACIRQCADNLHGAGDRSVAEPAAAVTFILVLLAAALVVTSVSQDTLVSMKIRLNN